MAPEVYHKPVMLEECLQGLDIQADGIYVDTTFGGGGHSKAILERLPNGHLYAFDQDSDASENAKGWPEERFSFIPSNFRFLSMQLKFRGVEQIDGLLADLGISSHQIDEAERGFSTRFDGPLDMRMDKLQRLSAKEVINKYSSQELHRIFGQYGEVQNARTLADYVVKERSKQEINTTAELIKILEPVAPRGKQFKYFAQVFQAIRIEVNQELGALEDLLTQTVKLIKPGGRLVVLSYHSLEDRMVKQFLQKGKFKGELEKDFFGNVIRPFKPLHSSAIGPSEEEQLANPRARSAKLRVAIKN
jgi:16S rRNA (cytosine1402-N4)-methyltransferase